MKKIELEQQTQEWLDFRKDKIGGSDAPAIMGCGYKTPYKLWLEKLGFEKTYETSKMRMGRELEGTVRDMISVKHNVQYEPCVYQSSQNPWAIASLDGYANGSIIEIKCLFSDEARGYAKNDLPDRFIYQALHQMYVMEAEKVTFVLYSGFELVEKEVVRDEVKLKELMKKEKEFYECLKNLSPPMEDLPERHDRETCLVASEWINAHQLLKEAEARLDTARQKLIDLSDNESFTCSNVEVKKIARKGSVDYKKIPELQGVNLDLYRKDPVSYWQISC